MEPHEKIFLCEELLGVHNHMDLNSMYKWIKRYNIPKTNIRRWLQIYKEGRMFHSFDHRPQAVDDEELDNFAELLLTKKANHEPVTEIAFGKALTEARNNTNNKRHLPVNPNDMDHRTIKKIKTKMDVQVTKPQRLTVARKKAMTCPRLTFRWACLLEGLSAHTDPHYKINIDATAALIKCDGAGTMVCTLVDDDDKSVIQSVESGGEIGVILKWMHLCTAAGECGPLLLIIAVASMPEGSFHVEKVVGLSNTADVAREGYILFTKTRAGNAAAWQWMFMHYVIPTLSM